MTEPTPLRRRRNGASPKAAAARPGCAAALPLAPLLERLRAGATTPRQHVGACLDRIATTERRVHALLPEPRRRARLEAALRAWEEPSSVAAAAEQPLLGVLVGVKDLFHVDGFATRAGTVLPPAVFAGPEAVCVRRLRAAGALVLGKTVSSELAYFEPGPTRNPHALRHTPGGSSSGSAAAVAAGFCPLALGTQTVGSVIRPAAFCGVVGYKPSYGRWSVAGVVPFSPSVDTVGVFAQDVAGVAAAAAVLDGPDPEPAAGAAPTGRGSRRSSPPDAPDRAARLPVLAVPAGPYLEQAEAEGLRLFAAQVRTLAAAGYGVRRLPFPADVDQVNGRHRTLIAGEVARVHASWFATYGHLCRPRTVAVIRQGQQVDAPTLRAARAGRARLRQRLHEAMADNGIDLWVTPAATGPAPASLATTGDPVMNLPWSHAGLPALSLPAGRAANGLPVGLQCVAAMGDDAHLLAWGRALAALLEKTQGLGHTNTTGRPSGAA